MRTPLDEFISSIPVTVHSSSLGAARDLDGECDAKCGTAATLRGYDGPFFIALTPEPSTLAVAEAHWPAGAQELIAWFEAALVRGELPSRPFSLFDHLSVVDPARWYGALSRDVVCGPCGPRAGVLLEELRQLREIVEAR